MTTSLDQILDNALRTTPLPSAPANGTSKHQLLDMRVSDITPDPDNPREDVGDVSELANSMAAAGLLQPIVVRRHTDEQGKTRHLVVAGHRRLAAAQLLGWKTAQVIVRADMRPDAVLAAMLIENGQRTDLDPIEEARALRKLKAQMGEGAKDADVARRVGRPQSHVASRMILLSLPIEEQEEIRTGAMTLTEGRARARIASGRIRTASIGRSGVGHLSASHDLAPRAKARCLRLKHSRGQGKGVGGIACGECWESVIRADERDHLHEHSARTGKCPICDSTETERTAS